MTTEFEFAPPKSCSRPYTISEVNAGVARILDERNTLVWVTGEISGFKNYPSGHCYFKLKDETSQIPAVMWGSSAAKLDFAPQNGMAVFAIANIGVYEKGGYYQLTVHRLMPAGVGALHLAFEKLKEKLMREGLFDNAHKKPLPKNIKTLGVITSATGAVLQDIINIVSRRAPQVDILVIDTLVQGDRCAAQIAKAIRMANDYNSLFNFVKLQSDKSEFVNSQFDNSPIDVLIVGRGGGSIEDLWGFNEEVVARAIFESEIPIVSAVGHETDFTIADFVADVRAPTPSAAAEIVTPDSAESLYYFETSKKRFLRAVNNYMDDISERVNELKNSYALQRPQKMLQDAEQALDIARGRVIKSINMYIQNRESKIKSAAQRLDALSPLAVLSRGYGIVSDNRGKVVRGVGDVNMGDMIDVKFSDGEIGAMITSIK